MFSVRPMQEGDLDVVVHIHRECFPEDNSTLEDARDWVWANWRAVPRTSYFVLVDKLGQVGGYILWMERGGFRREAVLELEQIAVTSAWRGMGGGRLLITEGLRELKDYLSLQERTLKLIQVTTGATNESQHLYRSTLGAEVEAIIHDLFGEDEVVMIARDP